jgi:hypothetical protein
MDRSGMVRPPYLACRKSFDDIETILCAYPVAPQDKQGVEERIDGKT